MSRERAIGSQIKLLRFTIFVLVCCCSLWSLHESNSFYAVLDFTKKFLPKSLPGNTYDDSIYKKKK